MRPCLKFASLTTVTLLTAAAPIYPLLALQLPAIAQTTQDKKAEGDGAALHEANRLFKQGIEQYQTSQYEAALQSWKQALTIYHRLQDRKGEAGALNNLGMAYRFLSQYNKAITYYQQALPIYQQVQDKNGVAGALNNLGMTYRFLSQYDKAITYYQQALSLFQQIKDKNGEANTLMNLGIAYDSLSQYDKAITYYQQALSLFQQVKDKNGEAGALMNLGNAYDSLSQHDKAITYYQQALPLFQQVKDKNGEAEGLNGLGLAYNALSQYDKAIGYFQQTLPLLQQVKDKDGEAKVLNNLGMAYFSLSQYEQAIAYYQQALPIYQQVKDKDGEAGALTNLGNAYNSMLQHKQAINFYKQALPIYRQVKDKNGEAMALNGLGSAYLSMSQYEQAVAYYRRALPLFQQIKDKNGEATALANLGTTYLSLSQYEQAIGYYQQALPIVQQVKDRAGEGSVLSSIGAFFKQQKQPELAIVFYKQSVNVRETIRGGIQNLPRESREAYTQSVAGTYRNLADLLIQQGRISEAQQVLELLKIQEINDFTRGTRSPNATAQVELNTIETQLRDRYGSLIAFGQKLAACEQTQCAERAALKTQLRQLQTEFNTLVSGIRDRLRDLRAQQVTTDTDEFISSAAKIVNAQPHTLLIYPLVLPDKVQILWATAGKNQGAILSGTTTSCPLHEATELNPLISDLQTHLAHQGDLKELQATSQKLYDCLIQPLERELKQLRDRAAADHTVPNLVFVPDRATHLIPMAVLFDGNHYLIETYNISNILSASKTDATAKLPSDRRSISVLGFGLSEAKPGFSALQYVPIELASIIKSKSSTASKGIYNGDEFLNQQFDQNALEAQIPGHTIVHIATHGVFKPSNPRNSFLLLGDGTEFAIPNIQFLEGLATVHLVVLSACETAKVGTDTNGTEVAGISSYFLQDRAKAVIASLWKVNDPATSLLMQQFYQNLANGTSKAAALRQVQLDFIQGKRTVKDAEAIDRAGSRRHVEGQLPVDSLAHPYYWAPFILIGNSL